MFAIAARMFKDKYKSLLVYSITSVLFMELYIAIFPTMSKMSDTLDKLMVTMPPALFKAFNIDPSSLSFGNIESLLASKHYSMIWPMMAVILAISLASHLIINEIDNGTAESLLSLPIKRAKIFVSRYITGLLMLIGFNVISIFSIIPLAAIHDVDFIWQNNVTLFIGSTIFSWACYSIAIFVSTIFSEKSKATMTTGGIILLAYFINILAGLNDNLVNMKYFSIFNYYSSESLLLKNIYPDYFVWAFSVIIISLSLAAFIRFKSRDVSV